MNTVSYIVNNTQEMGKRIMSDSYSESDPFINLMGCYAFTVINVGRVKATILGNLEIFPNQQYTFGNADCYPVVSNTTLNFDNAPGEKKLIVIRQFLVPLNECENFKRCSV